MRVSAIQLSYSDSESQADRIARAAALVRAQRSADLVVLPELWPAGGFTYRDWGRRAEDPATGPTFTALSAAAQAIGAYVHAGSVIEADERALAQLAEADYDVTALPELPDGSRGLWNTSLLIAPTGELVATYRKIHRFGFGSGEPKLLEAGEDIVAVEVQLPEGPVTLGLATCYDLRFPELFRGLLDAGAEVLVVPAAWPAPRVADWELLARARALEDFCAVVAVNTAGYHGGMQMGGHSAIIDAAGRPLAQAGADETIIAADIDVAAIRRRREDFPALADRRL
ncbi:apolipoprotein acyltransferase [Brevibacterium sp. 5221]|uniref:Apolipoprotein acyltransferase n=1 Tax=Brevibacterium rongguiense TaxID=2695267 RepID=A0A6N9HA81_9MICO|nr:nitrilase-related carbon-nitrogen hydrolase [Brevibacterium rongguiense]MYM20958.1 apolipoprotein acyltransferase [Brevibacterium rongguiense]